MRKKEAEHKKQVLAFGQKNAHRSFITCAVLPGVREELQVHYSRAVNCHSVVELRAVEGDGQAVRREDGPGYGLSVSEGCIGSGRYDKLREHIRIKGGVARDFAQKVCTLGLVKVGSGN